MRVCDYIAKTLHEHYGVERVYGLMGGGASGLNDGFIKYGKIKYICHHHEQGAGYAAFGESKYTNEIAVVNPTTGCGGTNIITPVLNAWQDGVPLVIISGNVRKTHTSNYINKMRNVSIRKYGVQEHDIINTVKNITKYARVVEHPHDIEKMLAEAIHEATTGRKGPVWLDVPSDVQTAELTPHNIKINLNWNRLYRTDAFDDVLSTIQNASRPLILAGNGIHMSNTRHAFKRFIEQYNIPYVSTYLARDLMNYDHRLNIGTIGIKGSRAGNWIMHHCDALIIMGCSLNATHIGYDEKQFSPYSHKIMIDVDANEYNKENVKIDKFYQVDLIDFFKESEDKIFSQQNYKQWKEKDMYAGA